MVFRKAVTNKIKVYQLYMDRIQILHTNEEEYRVSLGELENS